MNRWTDTLYKNNEIFSGTCLDELFLTLQECVSWWGVRNTYDTFKRSLVWPSPLTTTSERDPWTRWVQKSTIRSQSAVWDNGLFGSWRNSSQPTVWDKQPFACWSTRLLPKCGQHRGDNSHLTRALLNPMRPALPSEVVCSDAAHCLIKKPHCFTIHADHEVKIALHLAVPIHASPTNTGW